MGSDESYFNVTVGERSFFWDEARFERTIVPLRSHKLSYRTVWSPRCPRPPETVTPTSSDRQTGFVPHSLSGTLQASFSGTPQASLSGTPQATASLAFRHTPSHCKPRFPAHPKPLQASLSGTPKPLQASLSGTLQASLSGKLQA